MVTQMDQMRPRTPTLNSLTKNGEILMKSGRNCLKIAKMATKWPNITKNGPRWYKKNPPPISKKLQSNFPETRQWGKRHRHDPIEFRVVFWIVDNTLRQRFYTQGDTIMCGFQNGLKKNLMQHFFCFFGQSH